MFEIGQGEYEIIDNAFENLITEVSKGKKGQYFTPRSVIKMCVKMLNPKENEYIIDPACGSGGFLVAAMRHVWNQIEEKVKDPVDAYRVKVDYAIENIRGIDFNPDLARVSKMRMVLEDDGHTGIFSENSLESFEILKKTAQKAEATKIRKEGFKVILTNPPFGSKGKVQNKEILKNYDLGHKWKINKETRQFEKEKRRISFKTKYLTYSL